MFQCTLKQKQKCILGHIYLKGLPNIQMSEHSKIGMQWNCQSSSASGTPFFIKLNNFYKETLCLPCWLPSQFHVNSLQNNCNLENKSLHIFKYSGMIFTSNYSILYVARSIP